MADRDKSDLVELTDFAKEAFPPGDRTMFAGSPPGRVTASRTLRLHHCQGDMMQCVAEHRGISEGRAAGKLVSLATSARSEYVQLEASRDILDRTGFKPPDRKSSVVEGEITVNIDLG